MIEINKQRCKGCGLCVSACPKKLIELDSKERNDKGFYPAKITDNSKCINCKFCAMMCPDCAIKVYKEN